MSEQTTDLEKAIQYLGAQEISPGRYAFTNQGRKVKALQNYTNYFVADESGLVSVYEGKELRAFLHILPSWWTPEKPFALKRDGEILATYKHTKNVKWVARKSGQAITVNLATGEEVAL